MHRYIPGKVVVDEGYVVMREARDSVTGQKVNMTVLLATNPDALRKAVIEADTQRSIRSSFVCRVMAVDLKQEERGWAVWMVKEHCYRNLALEIRLRKESGKYWSEDALLTIGQSLISALAEIQELHAVIHRLDTRGLLVRKSGEVIIGSFEGLLADADTDAVMQSVARLGAILVQMAVLNGDEMAVHEGQTFLLKTDVSKLGRLSALVAKMRPGPAQLDFVQLRDGKQQTEVVFSSSSLPMESAPVQVEQALTQSLQQSKQCSACSRFFTTPSFDPARLRDQYRKYPLYLQSVCSIICLDTYIKYVATFAQETCIMCNGGFRMEGGGWRDGENDEAKGRVCSKECFLKYKTTSLEWR